MHLFNWFFGNISSRKSGYNKILNVLPMTTTYKLNPSDFAYLYQECKKCFYLKVRANVYRPRGIFPSVFTTINNLIQDGLKDKSLKMLNKDFPEGTVVDVEKKLNSNAYPDTSVFINGRCDLLVKNSDDTYTVVDLKISPQSEEKVELYQSQLMSYKFALENPNLGEPIKVTKLALLIFFPEKVEYEDDGVELDFPAKWYEVPIDEEGFKNLMYKINDLVTGPMPDDNPKCEYCKYRNLGKTL